MGCVGQLNSEICTDSHAVLLPFIKQIKYRQEHVCQQWGESYVCVCWGHGQYDTWLVVYSVLLGQRLRQGLVQILCSLRQQTLFSMKPLWTWWEGAGPLARKRLLCAESPSTDCCPHTALATVALCWPSSLRHSSSWLCGELLTPNSGECFPLLPRSDQWSIPKLGQPSECLLFAAPVTWLYICVIIPALLWLYAPPRQDITIFLGSISTMLLKQNRV